jgi:SAM-dependent methyltransferase
VPVKSVTIDGDGYFKMSDGLRFNDEATGQQWLKSLCIDEFGVCWFESDGQRIIVEPFDKPYVAQQVYLEHKLEILLPYNLRVPIRMETICVDQWDRFHGLCENDIPFVLTNKAQAELFKLCDEFDDESITITGHKISTPDFYIINRQADEEKFWTNKYCETTSPGWNLDEPHPSLDGVVAQIKPLKGRLAVLGCGYGHDAHYFAKKGHIVSAFDISPKAIEIAEEKYQEQHLNIFCQDVFSLTDSHRQNFDYIFEHTMYCAIPPDRRRELIKLWWNLLDEGGHLMGVFFVNPRRGGPPYGGSEWELQRLLEPYFDFRYWTRLKNSPEWRNGAELFVYAQKKEIVKS